MKRTLAALLIGAILAMLPIEAGARGAVAGGAQATAAQAAPFLGDWTLAVEGANGPGTFTVSLRMENEKVTGEIVGDALGKQPFTSIAVTDRTLSLAFSFLYEGNAVDAVASLTPDKEGKTAAQIDFASGAYVMTGTATRKDAQKQIP